MALAMRNMVVVGVAYPPFRPLLDNLEEGGQHGGYPVWDARGP